jgi:23S rRNA (uracil1939-C5)-methyltransferase
MAAVTLTVESIGARGDGIAHHRGERVFLPFTVPGDRLRAELGAPRAEGRSGRVLELLEPAERATAACIHFGACGGCALQHLTPAAYRAAKEELLRRALAQHGLPTEPVLPLVSLPAGTRRRASFAINRSRDAAARPLVGFRGRASHRIIDMTECPVLHPDLLRLVPALRDVAAMVLRPGGEAEAAATRVDGGIDLLFDLPAVPGLAALEALAAFAEAHDLARLHWRAAEEPVPLALRRPARVTLSGVAVDLPEDAFLQASEAADEVLAATVLEQVGEGARIADLFAGVGTLTFALAQRGTVHALDGARPALLALAAAAARAGFGGSITTELRDLERHPLSRDELRRFDLVVLDPPRAGAKAQSRALADAPVPHVIAVSCNPATFARDARILVDGGYRFRSVQPIDAFLWSPHLELVASFQRA